MRLGIGRPGREIGLRLAVVVACGLGLGVMCEAAQPGFVAGAGGSASRDGKPVLVDVVAANVNAHSITVGDVLNLVDPTLMQIYRRYEGAERKRKEREAFKSGLDALIERYLILDSVDPEKQKLPEWVIDEEVQRTVDDRFRGNREALMTQLASEKLSYEEWRKRLKEQLLVNYAKDGKLRQRSAPTPAEIEAAYKRDVAKYSTAEMVKLRMFVLKRSGTAEEMEAKRKQIDEIRAQLVGGADFAELAKKLSEGGKADHGGDQGWRGLDSLRSELRKVAEVLPVNELSQVVETADEIYVIRVEDRKRSGVRPIDEVRVDIEKQLRQEAYERLYTEWIERLKKESYVKVFDLDGSGADGE